MVGERKVVIAQPAEGSTGGKESQQRTEAPLNQAAHAPSSLQAQSQNEGLKELMTIPSPELTEGV